MLMYLHVILGTNFGYIIIMYYFEYVYNFNP